ncbi:KTSC domain-containing protein [Compostibacter hankyongensis]|uniref:KTSC domain-containing protein n=1 Tax=Compostibacter hankyongensis TaxID=1007089 RepID=A0ABP8FXW1_9BACT
MRREAVNSSVIASVGYDEQNKILEIAFHHGGIYQYSGVPLSIYEGLMSADSLGHYFAENIRNGYEYIQL